MWKRSVNRTVLGYIGGRTHYKDLDNLKPVMSKLWGAYRDKLHVNIHGITTHNETVQRIWRNMIQSLIPKEKYMKHCKQWPLIHWNEYAFYYDYNDIVISSVQESDFNACKSELKVLEAGAKWTPIVCTDFVTYNRVKMPGLRLASTPQEWYDHLSELITNKEERNKYGKLLGQYVREEYDWKKENEIRLNSLK